MLALVGILQPIQHAESEAEPVGEWNQSNWQLSQEVMRSKQPWYIRWDYFCPPSSSLAETTRVFVLMFAGAP